MTRRPRNPKKGVFSVYTAIILLIQGFSMSLIALTVFLLAYYVEDYEPKHNRTLTFMVLCSILSLLSSSL